MNYCLRSLKKWEPETPVTIVAPETHYIGHPATRVTPAHWDGYVDQQDTKLKADLFVPATATHVVHMDSDCILTGKLSGLFESGKPILLKTPYDKIEDDSRVWREITAHYMGFDPEYEYMRRMPLAYPLSIYKKVREYLIGRLGPWGSWFPGIQNRRISEFNILGAYAERFMPEEFHWVNTESDPLPGAVARQAWSWGGLACVAEEWERLT